jgi:hypothetical protein
MYITEKKNERRPFITQRHEIETTYIRKCTMGRREENLEKSRGEILVTRPL